MKFRATKPVSLFWQTLFAIILDAFAYYRIKKLRRYLLIVVIPATVISTLFSSIFANLNCISDWWLYVIYDTCQTFEHEIIYALIRGGFLIFSIYLIRKWSVEWNNNMECKT